MRVKKIYKGVLYEFVTIGEIAKESGRTISVIRKYIERGIIPESNFRLPPTTKKKDNTKILGARIYSSDLSKKLVAVIKTFRQGIPVTEEQKTEINKIFMEEKQFFNL